MSFLKQPFIRIWITRVSRAVGIEIHNRQAYFVRVSYINAQFISKHKFRNLTTRVHGLMLKQNRLNANAQIRALRRALVHTAMNIRKTLDSLNI